MGSELSQIDAVLGCVPRLISRVAACIGPDDPEYTHDGQAFAAVVKAVDSVLPPAETAPSIRQRPHAPSKRECNALDALLVIAASPYAPLLALLPERERWRRLHARSAASALTQRSTTLANDRQTAAVLGYAKPGVTSFERLQLAGRMAQEIAGRRPARIGLLVDSRLKDAAAWSEALLSALRAHSFALPNFRSKAPPRWTLRNLLLYGSSPPDVVRTTAVADANNLARWLTAMPPNRLTARSYRQALEELAGRQRLQLKWYGESELQRLGAGAFLAVTRANAARDAGIAHLRWHGRAGQDTDVALIGKGILFDTGGINLKTHRSMLDMHTDMAGSAVALATLLALRELRVPLNVDAWLAITENNTGPTAYRPQEVVQAMNGTTIQVIHSDAEGRLALADTLALAGKTQPQLMIDYATLTGACVYALTERYSGVFSNRSTLAQAAREAGERSGERLWPFPLDEDFDTDLESSIADIRQCAIEGKGDHILAARFLQRFVPASVGWLHMDLSAATRTGGLGHVPTEITGFGVRCSLQLLLEGEWRSAPLARR